MPGAVPVTSAHALNNATLSHGLQLADRGLKAIGRRPAPPRRPQRPPRPGDKRPGAEALGYEAQAPERALQVA